MRAFVEEHGLEEMPQAVDADGSIWAMYGISYQPAWVFINQDGEATVHAGSLFGDGITREIDALLAR